MIKIGAFNKKDGHKMESEDIREWLAAEYNRGSLWGKGIPCDKEERYGHLEFFIEEVNNNGVQRP